MADPREDPTSRSLFWDNVLRFQAEKVSPWVGLRNAAGVALPVAIGAAIHATASGLLIATGALNVAFSDSQVPYAQRARRMLAASVLVGCSVLVGALCARSHPVTLLVAAAWAFAAGMLVALDAAAADIGTISLVTLLVFAGLPMRPAAALLAGLLASFGGLALTSLAVGLWPLRRYVPQRRAIGQLFRGLAASASASTRATEAPLTSTQSTEAQDSLAALGSDHSLEAERHRALLSQAERMRLGLLVLARLHTRIERENPGDPALVPLDRFFEIAAELLHTLADELLKGTPLAYAGTSLDQMRALAEGLRTSPGGMLKDARRQMDALAGQFRAALDLAAHAIPEGAARFQQSEAVRPWRFRLQGTVATLRANLSLQSAACRHAIRLSVCVALGEALGQALGLTRAYWVPMTVAIVLKPDFSATFTRGVQRFAGTFAGLLLATALFHFLPLGTGLEVVLLAAFTFTARALGPANYGIAATAITALVVMLMALNGLSPGSVILPRGINTVVGGALALVAYWIWPTWERTQLSETIAHLLDAYAAYFHGVRSAYMGPSEAPPRDLDGLRQAGRRARSNLEASADRFGAEPGASREHLLILGGLLANSHRLAHAFMALEAGLSARRHSQPIPAFREFAEHVEIAMASLAATLRGSAPASLTFPDLREDYQALLRAGESDASRYALINVEADRVVNSLNTIGEEVQRWILRK